MIISHIFISIFIILFSRLLFSKAFGFMNIKMYMPHTHLWLWQMVVLSFIGANLMFMGINSAIIENFVDNPESYLFSLWSVYYMLLIFPIAVIFFNMIFRFKIGNNLKAYINSDVTFVYSDKDKCIKAIFIGMVFVSFLVVAYLSYYKAPLFMYLTGRISQVLSARIEYSRAFGGSAIIKNVIGETLVPLSSYIAFAYYKYTKQKSWRNIFFALTFCALFISGAGMSKSGLAYYLIPFLFIMAIMDRKLPYKNIIKALVIILPIILYMYTIQYSRGNLGVIDIISNFHGGPIGRILIGQIQALPSYFEIFPEQYPYLLGKSIALFRYIGLPFIESGRIAATFLEPAGVSSGWVGVANTLFIGDAYANFGIIGVLISPIWVSFVYSVFYWKLISSQKTPLSIGFYVFILDNLTASLTGGFFAAYVVNTRIIAAILFLLLIKILVQFISKRPNLVTD